MNHVSIFEKKWLDLVFEGKNKAYGAYQLRLENPKTTLLALFFGLMLLTSAVGVSAILNKLTGGNSGVVMTNPLDDIIQITTFNPQQPNPPKTEIAPAATASEPDPETQLENPVIVAPNEANQNIATNANNAPSTPEAPGTGIPGENPTPGTSAPNNPGTEAPAISTGPVPTALLDKLPEYPNGIENFYRYITRNFEKPEINDAKTVRVFVSFVIEKDGSMTDIKVTRDPGYGLGKEALRVLKSLKVKWEPGLVKGDPVRTAYNLPITVNME